MIMILFGGHGNIIIRIMMIQQNTMVKNQIIIFGLVFNFLQNL